MAFQFLCPEGHLLQGEESQAGQQCKCPYCQTEFLVPRPTATPQGGAETPGQWADAPPETTPEPAIYQSPPADEPEQPGPEGFPGIRIGEGSAGDGPTRVDLGGGSDADVLHIICPNGHELETPREMLGQDAMCPFCQAQFQLRREDSREYRQEKTELEQRRERKLGRAWMNWAIATAVVVVLGVIVLVVIAVSD
jgi:uncharacterized Zn-finger protein